MTREEWERARAELAAAATARLDGFHGGLDSSQDLLPGCAACRWCHTTGSPAGDILIHTGVGVGD